MNQKLRKETVAVHGGSRKDDAFGAINEPIYMTSNYRIPTDGTPVDWSGIHSNIYCRNRNVNQMVLQDKLCALTGAEDCAIFASGVAALAAVFTTMLNSGDHAIVSEVCYSATNLLFREYLPKKYGVEVTLLDTTDTEAKLYGILAHLIHHIADEVEALLIGQTGYDTDHHRLRIDLES